MTHGLISGYVVYIPLKPGMRFCAGVTDVSRYSTRFLLWLDVPGATVSKKVVTEECLCSDTERK